MASHEGVGILVASGRACHMKECRLQLIKTPKVAPQLGEGFGFSEILGLGGSWFRVGVELLSCSCYLQLLPDGRLQKKE